MKVENRILKTGLAVCFAAALCGCSEQKSVDLKPRILQSLRDDYLWAGTIEDVMNLHKIAPDTFVGKAQWKGQYGNVEYFDIVVEFLENGAVEIQSMDHRFRMFRNPFPNQSK